jgi:hypothetical protein
MSTSTKNTTLVVGATGNTGKHVVQFLLDQKDQTVKVVCRSKEKMLSLLKQEDYGDRLQVVEDSITQVKEEDLKKLTQDCSAVVSCLGHNITLSGMWGRQDRRLVKDTAERLTKAMPTSAKFVLMGSCGISVPGDDQRSFGDRVVLSLLRLLVPPHVDNEEASAYVLSLAPSDDPSSPEWCIVRPTNLQEGPPQKYVLHSKPPEGLFGDGIVTRATVARFIVDLLTDSAKWNSYKYQTPVIHDDPASLTETTTTK